MTPEEALQSASEALDSALAEKARNKELIKTLGPAIVEALKPALEKLAENSRLTKEDIKQAISEVSFNLPEINVPKPNVTVNVPEIKVPKAEVTVTVPEIKIPTITIPPIKVPRPEVTVNIPPFDFPEPKQPIIRFPEIINLGYNYKNPLPVNVINQVSAVRVVGLNTSDPYFDANGFLKVNVAAGTLTVGAITGITNSIAAALVDSNGVQYSGSNPLPVSASLSISGVQLQDGQGSIITSHPGNLDHRGLDVAIIDGSGNQITSFGGGTQYLSTDNAAGIGTGTLALGVQSSTATALTTKDLGWALPLYDSNNAEYVNNAYKLDPVNDSVTIYAASGFNASVNVVTFNGNAPAVGLNETTNGVLRVIMMSDTVTSTVINSGTLTGVTNSIQTVLVDSSGVAYSGSNPVPTSGSASLSAAVGQGDAASALRIVIAGNSDSSVVVNSGTLTNLQQFNGNTPAQGLNETTAGVLRVVMMSDTVNSTVINSGTLTTLSTLTNITNSVATVLTDSSGVAYSGSNPIPTTASATLSAAIGQGDTASALRVVHAGDSATSVATQAQGLNETTSGVLRVVMMTDAVSSVVVNSGTITTVTTLTNVTSSIQSALIDSGGVQYSGGNPVPITIISGAVSSVLSVGDSAARTADNAGNPVKIGGIARTTNPAAYADGDRANFASDKLGRQLTRPVQVRDLIATAYVTLTTGTEATLLAAGAGTFLDLIMLTATNQSTAAVQLDIRNITAGNIIHTMVIPASTGPVGFTPTVPWPQDATGNTWTIDMPDITGTTVNVSALFSKEI